MGIRSRRFSERTHYLFVDEAGQVAVANLIAMSRSATNLILMGDQMQLGQPSQGTHPADSGLSRIIDVPSVYEGPLNIEAGVLFVPVEHEGNTQASDEEVAVIRELANSLIGRTFFTGKEHTGKSSPETRPIDWNDILFVAPYNHQVSKLRAALGEQAKVGSVDKFQGQ